MAKVTQPFHCIQTNKKYNVGDDYKGNRKDLGGFLEKPKKSKSK